MGAANDDILAAAGPTGTNIMAGPIREVIARAR